MSVNSYTLSLTHFSLPLDQASRCSLNVSRLLLLVLIIISQMANCSNKSVALKTKLEHSKLPLYNQSFDSTDSKGCSVCNKKEKGLNGESEISKNSSTPSSASSGGSLDSLSIYLKTKLSLVGHKYTPYATSYIPFSIPTKKILSFETDSGTEEPSASPFKNPIKLKEFELQEINRKEIGQSERIGKIVPSSKPILKEIERRKFKNPNKQREFLFYKAQQWCEVNQALSVDSKYPRIKPKVIRSKFSSEHRKACKAARKAEPSAPSCRSVFKTPGPSFPFPIPLETATDVCNKNKVVEGEKLQQEPLVQKLDNVLELHKTHIIQDSKSKEPCWQIIASKTASLKPKPVKKRPFKPTEYPPKSRAEKIADLRKLLPPLRPFEEQTDTFSGIWSPEIVSDEFHITPLQYDSRIASNHFNEEDITGVDWFAMRKAKDKCKAWLDNIPDQLS